MINGINSQVTFKGKLYLPVYVNEKDKNGKSIVTTNTEIIDTKDIQSIFTTKGGNTMIFLEAQKGIPTRIVPGEEVPVCTVIAAYNAVKDNKMTIDLTKSFYSPFDDIK